MKKQFIAGAKCPQCGLEDKIFVYHKDGDDIAQCNACSYQSIRPKEVEPIEHEEERHADEDAVEVVKIFERKP